MSRQYVNNNKFKTLLVFNNNKNILGLTKDNFIEKTKEQELEKTQEKETIEKQKTKEKNQTSIFITLSGNEKETYKGIYLPISDENVLYIPKDLYKKNNNSKATIRSFATWIHIISPSILYVFILFLF